MPYTFLKLYYTCLWITPPPPIEPLVPHPSALTWLIYGTGLPDPNLAWFLSRSMVEILRYGPRFGPFSGQISPRVTYWSPSGVGIHFRVQIWCGSDPKPGLWIHTHTQWILSDSRLTEQSGGMWPKSGVVLASANLFLTPAIWVEKPLCVASETEPEA